MSKENFKVLLVGGSGKGKTYTARSLDQQTTGFVNAENKPLPFKGNFKYHSRPRNYKEAFDSIVEFAKNPDIEVIFIDSFSAILEFSLVESRKTKKGFDVWNAYNEAISGLIELIKKVPKHVLVNAHYDVIENADGINEKVVKSKGKEWRGQIEREFTVVLFADSKADDKGKPEYWFNTFQEGTTAKCPPDLFGGELKVKNDGKFIVEKIKEFTEEPVKA
jgi:ABC-type oligopeptide transport system ATPase subunit